LAVLPQTSFLPAASLLWLNAALTRLLREAQAAGCITASGVDMFVGQAVAQFELWTGQPAPADVMREVVMRRLTGKG